MAVIVTLVGSLTKSDKFQEIFGSDSMLIDAYKAQMEYSYRHGLNGREHFREPNYSNSPHDTFSSGGNTRFFSPMDKYPQ